MHKGIFNPYKKEMESPPVTEETDDGVQKKPTIRLDGDSYIIELQNTLLEEVPRRLVNLLKDVDKQDLKDNGVILLRNTDAIRNPNVMVLPVDNATLCVYTGLNGNEIEVYRRLGKILYGYPDITKKHNTKIIVRA